LVIDPQELFGKPGRYPFVCRFHGDRGMTGVLVIVA
jgi:plastocyanin